MLAYGQLLGCKAVKDKRVHLEESSEKNYTYLDFYFEHFDGLLSYSRTDKIRLALLQMKDGLDELP